MSNLTNNNYHYSTHIEAMTSYMLVTASSTASLHLDKP